jgi:secernin
MCDTFVALSSSTRDGSVLFGKNSDREPNEAQCVVTIPATDHLNGSKVKCTYIEIPQIAHTHAVILSKPFWMWGAEMGSNEFGVTIGNEAVFTRVPYEKGHSLTGMDLLRLALERSKTAAEGLKIITTLLETYGQGGNCGFTHPFYYHNSFLIADLNEAWILETAGKQWAALKVKDVGAISNHITIENEWDFCSDGLIDFALEKGYCKKRADFNFRKAYSDPLFTFFSDARNRNSCTHNFLRKNKGNLKLSDAMNLLRNHRHDDSNWSPDVMLAGSDVCMHAGFGPVRINQTVGSLVSQIISGNQTHWVTGTAAPCMSHFKPVWIDSGVPESLSIPTGKYDHRSVWWQHEILHRGVLGNYRQRLAHFRRERDSREANLIQLASKMQNKTSVERKAFSELCFKQGWEDTGRWIESVRNIDRSDKTIFYFKMAWNKFNKEAAINELL